MGRKKLKKRSFTFRVLQASYDLLEQVAGERGVDVADVLNEVLAEAAPALTAWLDARRGTSSAQRIRDAALRVFELVETPANYRAVKRVLDVALRDGAGRVMAAARAATSKSGGEPGVTIDAATVIAIVEYVIRAGEGKP